MKSQQQRIQALEEAIANTYEKSTFPIGREELDYKFSPEGSLDDILDKECITNVLTLPGSKPEPDEQKLVEFILKDAKKLFAISFMINLGDTDQSLKARMTSFKENGFCDKHLPVDQPLVKRRSSTTCFWGDGWTRRHREDFPRHQWIFLVPRFPEKNQFDRMQLHSGIIFPFKLADSTRRQGAFGAVWKA